jgi:hypothetical protein
VIATPDALVDAEIVPQVAPLQPVPENVHFTPRFCVSLLTVAAKGVCRAACTLAGVGATLTEITGAAVMVICVEAVFAGFASAAARMVTTPDVGTLNGAVYFPLLIVPTVEFPPTMPLTCQITLVSVEFLTVALNCSVPEVLTVLLVIVRSIVTFDGSG